MELQNLIFETSGMGLEFLPTCVIFYYKTLFKTFFSFLLVEERMGFTRDQRIECAGICALQLAVQVLGM